MQVGVVGAGTMGMGIALAFAQAQDFQVCLCDVNELVAGKSKKKIAARLQDRVERGRISQEEMNRILGNIRTGTKYICEECEFVIETAPDILEVKQSIYKELAQICSKDCIFATSTSALSITGLSHGMDRPIVGMHFFNPAPVMKLVEVCIGMDTPQEYADRVCEIAKKMGKIPIQIPEFAGFIVDRILFPMINEAIGIYAENDIDAAQIDLAMKLGANHPIGPLALGDMIGLDVVLRTMQLLQAETGDPKYRPHPLLRKMVRCGRLGRKTGLGFYRYENGRRCDIDRDDETRRSEKALS